MARPLYALLALTALMFPSRLAHAAEPQAAKKLALPVSDGLLVWLDASAQRPTPAPEKANRLPEDIPLERWGDASGHHRDLLQDVAEARPMLRVDGDLAFVCFDGDDFLALDKLGLAIDEMTVFLVAAPYRNEGFFRGMASIHAIGANDYTSGLNIDLGPSSSSRWDVINIEGAGRSGFHNYRTDSSDFLRLQRLCITSAVGPRGIALYVNGQPQGKRERTASTIKMDRLLVGARSFDSDPARSFFSGEIAEVIIYDRVLSAKERSAVDDYLAAKYSKIEAVPPPRNAGTRLQRVASPPPVQMHVGGFAVRELPFELQNINNVLYREDGTLVALGYNGNVYLLNDSDGDGLEDRIALFWENKGQITAPIGMALTPPGYARGQGVFVASKGKCSLLLDADRDNRAEEEVVIATGWPGALHQVDALGVAVDPRDQSVYFGIGTTNFVDAYVRTPEGVSQYRLDGEKGTILRVAPDFKSREIVATGIRFPVAIRFNARGDLFCTDQEGATWLPNGNPFDELLHIERGRHYGFPPRHPRHLPGVIDEPSVFDYRPQHQSTCGLNFNEPTVDGTILGPDWWRGDAIVTGYSRGKLYRTTLVPTDAGYIAQNQLLATLNMLTSDACIAPGHSAVVAVHSGGPDWGSGASGKGKLYKISYSDQSLPIPTLVWAQTPHEVRIAFDRPVDPAMLKELGSKVTIDAGEFAVAGERFESLWPGYAVVEHQLRAPRFDVEVYNVQLSADRRTLILSTAPHVSTSTYAVTLPGVRPATSTGGVELPQQPDIDLQYDLNGVAASWQPRQGDVVWQGWLPHLATDVSRSLTRASAAHDELWERMQEPGVLSLRTALDLRDMLRPVVQPGSKIDYQWPTEQVTLTLRANGPLEVNVDGTAVAAERSGDAWVARITMVPAEKEGRVPLEVRLRRDANDRQPSLAVHYHTNEDSRPRALALTRLVLPWAKSVTGEPLALDHRELPELQGGNWLRGRKEFFGEQAGCSKCHKVRGEGGAIGPDLSNLIHRDYASVLRDITQPSFAINPDHASQVITLTTGRVLNGTISSEGNRLIVAQQDGTETAIERDEIDEIQPSSISIMPEGIPKLLGPERLRDLLTFLMVEAPHMPEYGEGKPPAPRTMEEVQVVLAGSATKVSTRPIHIVLVAGPKDHGPGEHDYPAWQTVWKDLFGMADNVRVTTADVWPTADDLKSADVMVFYQQGQWTPERARDIDAYLGRGGGLVYIHYAVDGGADAPGFAKRIGLAWQGLRSKFRHGPLDVQFVPGSNHPIARNLDKVHFHDESYWNLVGDPKQVQLLGTGIEEGQPQPLFWTLKPGGGRVFVSIPGHFSWTFDDPIFRVLLLRGIAWAANEPVDRFNELVTPGARIQAAGSPDRTK